MEDSIFRKYTLGLPISTGDFKPISDIKNLDYNLIYTIKEYILPLNGYVNRVTETISPGNQIIDPETNLTVTPYYLTEKDLVYFNPLPVTCPPADGVYGMARYGIDVYGEDGLAGNQSCSWGFDLLTTPQLSLTNNLSYIDYLNGIVYYSGVQQDNLDVVYDYYAVGVQDGFPDWGESETLENIRLPVISIEMDDKQKYPFGIGQDYYNEYNFTINILANNDSQIDDLTNIIEDSLRYTYNNTIDYKAGFPINFNGSINEEFNRNNKWKQVWFKENESYRIRDFTKEKLRHQTNIFLKICII